MTETAAEAAVEVEAAAIKFFSHENPPGFVFKRSPFCFPRVISPR
jgi:hypothetical protein